MRRIASTVAALLLLVLAGCAGGGRSGSGGRAAAPGPAGGFEAHAAKVAEDWRTTGAAAPWRTGLVPLGPLTDYQAPHGFPTDAAKLAYGSGRFRATGPLSTDRPPAAELRWPDGSSLKVPVGSPAEAYQAIHTADPPPGCGGDECAVLTVTGAQLGTAPLRTSRGVVTVPVWRFTVTELPAPVVRVAVAASAITMPPEAPPGQPLGDASGVEGVSVVPGDDRRLTLHFIGGACDTSWTGLRYETPDAVVVGVRVVRKSGTCPLVAIERTTEVRLDAPLGNRIPLDVTTGMPLAVGLCGPAAYRRPC